jgi:non-ribosomal peptide synthetase-like protein
MILSDYSSNFRPDVNIPVNCLHQLFESRADTQAQNPAIIYQSTVISYGEVEARSNQLAWLLQRRGVVCGSRVGLLLPRSPELYIAILAILKAGGAYIPLDPEYPADRIEYILTDCAIQTIITTADLAIKKEINVKNIVSVDTCTDELALEATARLSSEEVPVGKRDLSYIIYTSGSTGRPKGVEIEHRSSVNYIQVVNREVYHVAPEDRVYQGFSIAFDASVEEVWCTFAAGAALVVGSIEQVRSGVDLAHFLAQQQVTVLSCVPTLLAMMEVEVPTIRLLILGGEQCPQELATRWCNDKRRVVNTYGPTEATVVSTWHECHPDRVITIGKPLPTYQVYILDEDLETVAPGVEGEIHIGGICLARGYVNRPDLTAEKFIPNPFTFDPDTSDKLYKTGDLGSWTEDGEIQFLGRIDGQVKLRGFRIELAEIESVIMHCAGVSAAVVAVKQVVEIESLSERLRQRLIAYLVPRQDTELDLAEIWDTMRSRLPVYMVPASIEILDTLPILPSGKVDRKNLPAPVNFGANLQSKSTGRSPSNSVEQEIATAWELIFGLTGISIDHEFFNELGGHSLLAAMMVSKLREKPQFQDLAVLDVYQHPTIAKLAAELTNRWQQRALVQAQSRSSAGENISQGSFVSLTRSITTKTKAANTIWASIGVYLMYVIYSLPLLIPGFIYYELTDDNDDFSRIGAGAISGAFVIAMYPALILLSIAIKWLVIGKFKPGKYPLWSAYYWRFWLVQQVQSFVPIGILTGSPLLNWYYRLMGAKIGKDVYLGTTELLAFDLVNIGDRTSIGNDSRLLGYEFVDGWLEVGRIDIGKDCCVGTNSSLGLNSHLADGAELGDLSYLPDNRAIPQGEAWVGSPARLQIATNTYEFPTHHAPPGISLFAYLGYAIGTIGQLLVPAIAAIPGFLLWCKLIGNEHWYLWVLPCAVVGSVSFIGVFCLQVVILKQLLVRKVRPGTYPLHGSFGLRHWFIDRLMALSLDMVPTLYSTLYLLPWLRMLGAKIGARAEISTASHITPDLLSIGSESFIADSVSLGASQVKHGWLRLAHTHIGSQAFVGNGAVVPGSGYVADNCLIGCMSVPPEDSKLMRPDSAWMGSPAIYIPHRQIVDEYTNAETYKPSRHLYWQRLAIEFCRATIPGSIHFIVLLAMEVTILNLPDYLEMFNLPEYLHFMLICATFPLIYGAASICSALFVIALKWLVVGRYKPRTIPLWNNFVWRTEFITGLYESMIVAGCLGFFLGTPFAAIVLRLLGMRVGKGVYIETTDFTEFDLISIDDNVILNHDCTLQTHLFEDRVMKMERIRLERGCQLGTAAVVLYDSLLESNVLLQPMSLIMKGERLPASTDWQGIPASRVYT